MDFKLPDIGEGVHEGEITKWLVKAGDPIKADQPMVEVMTDKATVEIPSPVTGVVSGLFAKEGETIEVGKVIVTIQEGNAAPQPTATKPIATEAKPQVSVETKNGAAPKYEAPRNVAPASSTVTPDEVLPFGILATPATRKLSRELEVDLKSLKGTGVNGRITKEDVLLAYGA
jgi:pyruvate dehydrogenase E2 component (dihydrolipoamide acetyltransferase)